MNVTLVDGRNIPHKFDTDDILYVECYERGGVTHVRTRTKLWAMFNTKMSNILLQFINLNLTEFAMVVDSKCYYLVNLNRTWGNAYTEYGNSYIIFDVQPMTTLRIENEIAHVTLNKELQRVGRYVE